MAPLKSLEVNYPLIDSDFQQFCALQGIFSVEDFLIRDLYMLVALAEQYPTSDRLKEGITQILSIMDCEHQPWKNALELLEDSQKCKQFLSVGCQRIDAFLHGGLQQGFLTELVGSSSSGKTQDNNILPQILDNIICCSVFDVFKLLDVLHELWNNLKYQTVHNLKMLIVDSISSLIAPVLGGNGAHGHALMASVGYLLKKLAHDHNLAVLITNHMVAGEGGTTKPALGESWKSIPHVRLMVSQDPGSNSGRISVLMHPAMAIGSTVEYSII